MKKSKVNNRQETDNLVTNRDNDLESIAARVAEIEALRLQWMHITDGAASATLDTRPVGEWGEALGEIPEAYKQASQVSSAARSLWIELTYDLVGWALWDDVATDWIRRKDGSGLLEQGRQSRLELWNSIHSAILHRPRTTDYPCIAVLSSDLALQLHEALRALNSNELQPLFWTDGKPSPTPGMAIRAARSRAVQSVAYLEGKGEMVTPAQTKVAAAHQVGREAIRKWESNKAAFSDPLIGPMRRMSAYSDRARAFLAGCRDRGLDSNQARDAFGIWSRDRLKNLPKGHAIEFADEWPMSDGFLVDQIKDYERNGREYRKRRAAATAQADRVGKK